MTIFEWISRITSETLWREHMRNKNRIKKLEQHINQLQLEVASLHMRVGAATAGGFEAKEMIQEDRAAAILLEDISAQERAALRRDVADIKAKLESSGIVDNWSIT